PVPFRYTGAQTNGPAWPPIPQVVPPASGYGNGCPLPPPARIANTGADRDGCRQVPAGSPQLPAPPGGTGPAYPARRTTPPPGKSGKAAPPLWLALSVREELPKSRPVLALLVATPSKCVHAPVDG